MTATLLPLFVNLRDALVTVTGGGSAAIDAARMLAGFADRVQLVAPDLAAARSVLDGRYELIEAAPAGSHLDGAALLVTASQPVGLDEDILAIARGRGMITVALNEASGRACFGHAVGEGPVLVAATTSGACPELDVRLAREAAKVLLPEHERLAGILAGLRAKLEERFPDEERRSRIWQAILDDSPIVALLQAGQDDEARELAERMAWGTG